ncbi:MAG: GntR family transcriptional regulator [Bilifractor sp.]|jgi:DNA-binding GntR family transcriptional regulator
MIAVNNTRRAKLNVYQELKDRIQYLEMMPGEPIKESTLTEKLGVSRTPIREALIRLSSEDLIDIYPQRGTYVSEINFAIAKECAYMRHILDSDVCLKLCREKANLEDDLEDSLFFMKKAIKNKDVRGYIQNDNSFHAAIFRAAGHEMTWDIIADSRAHYNRVLTLDLRRKGIMRKSLNEHLEMIRLIREGKEEELVRLMDIHHDYSSMDQRESELRKEFPDYFKS